MMHEPLHPGVILREVLIDSTGLSISEVAVRLGVTRTTLFRSTNINIIPLESLQSIIKIN